MDQWNSSSQIIEHDSMDPVAARKSQKADREKVRRDRLNEQFIELGKAVDPARPKNDKATILGDTIQLLKDMTTQVKKLKTEHTALSEESRELTQEKNELKEEKVTLKSEVDSLNVQYQMRLRCVYPWAPTDPSVVMGPPPPYPYPMHVIHPSMQPYPFFRNQTHEAVVPNVHYAARPHPSSSRSQNSRNGSLDNNSNSNRQRDEVERSDEFSDVVTELELKTPGSAGTSSHHSKSTPEQDMASGGSKAKQWSPQSKGKTGNADRSGSSRQSSSSNSVEDNNSSVGNN